MKALTHRDLFQRTFKLQPNEFIFRTNGRLSLSKLTELLHKSDIEYLQYIVLSSNIISSLPPEIGQLTALTYLDLSNNKVSALPPEIGQLTALRSLNLSDNILSALPPEIGQLSALESLSLDTNQLSSLPSAIGNLTALKVLDIQYNALSALPNEIGNLVQLERLHAWDNQISSLPESLGKIRNLKTLALGGNPISVLPEWVQHLEQLSVLDLRNTQLTSLPEWIGNLKKLRNIYLLENKISSLPESIRELDALEALYLHDNPALGIPPEILGPTWRDVKFGDAKPAAPKSILDYYFRIKTEPTRRLNEAKMLLVGQGGVGKTSLAEYLVSGKRCDATEKPTEGINIKEWQVQGKEGADGAAENVNVHVWDFGGQEIMHATHQFFLTRRSLYLVVLDARAGEQESNIHYWLKIIGSYGGDSPVLVIINKCDQHPYELNETALRRDYPNINRFIQTSCENGWGIEELKEEITKQIRLLPNVFDELPQSYFQVKADLTAAAAAMNYIPIGEYHNICARHRVAKKEDQNQLIRFLHDLGILLNFQDPRDPYGQNDPYVLNPEWVTEGVYAIVNDKVLKAQKDGVLTQRRLTEALNAKEGYPANHHDFIVRKMIQFELAYELDQPADQGQRWLVPELLDPNEPPDLAWKPEESLNFQYSYQVLPAGVICRFIVRMHHHVQREQSWRSGTVLNMDGNAVLVRGDIEKNRVFIAVQGDMQTRRERLAVVRDAFRAIHATIPKLKPAEEVPLPDKPEIAVPYDHLLKLEQHGHPDYFPVGADSPYNVQTLLNGVDSALYRHRRRQSKVKERENMGQKHVFISYCHDNKNEVAHLVDDLKTQGESIWWDEGISGDWKEVIDKAMGNAYAVVICLSPELTLERYKSGVYPEIRDAIDIYRQYAPGQEFLFPVKLAACEIPPIKIDATRTLQQIQCIDLFPEDRREEGIEKLLISLSKAPGRL